MKRILLLISFLITFEVYTYGQSIPSYNYYSSFYQLKDSLTYSTFIFEPFITYNKFDYRIDESLDSNTYVRLDWKLGSINDLGQGGSNQEVNVSLIKPMPFGDITFGFKRTGFLGWMESSSYRLTNANLGFTKRISPSSGIQVVGSFYRINAEYNSGLNDSSYLFIDNETIKSWQLDIASSDELSQITAGDFSMVYSRLLLENSVSNLSFASKFRTEYFGYSYQLGGFNNGNIVSNYSYSGQEVSDSLTMILPQLQFGVDYLRTKGNLKFSSQLNVDYSYVDLRNNEAQYNTDDLKIGLNTDLVLKKTQLGFNSWVGVVGWNNGSFSIRPFISRKDSLLNAVLNNRLLFEYSKQPYSLRSYWYNSTLKTIRNDIINPTQQNLSYRVDWTGNILSVGLTGTAIKIENYQYFDKTVSRYVDDVFAAKLEPEITLITNRFKFKSIFTKHFKVDQFYFSFPEFVSNSEISYELPVFKKAAYIELGLNSLYYSSYYAKGFHPFIGMMYAQDDIKFDPYLRLDAFMKASIGEVSLEFRAANVLYGLIGEEILVGPNYPGVPRYFQLHLNWLFKN